MRGVAGGQARLHRLHPDPDRARPLRARGDPGRVAGAERRGAIPGRAAGALDRGGRLHAPHGPGPGRDDARGRGRRAQPGDFEELLRGAPRERAGETAPPHGLYLASVQLSSTLLSVLAAAQLDLAEARGAVGQVDRGAGGQEDRLALGVGHRGARDGDRAARVDHLGPRRQLAVVGRHGTQEVRLQVEAGEGEPTGTVVSTAISIAKSASIAIAPPWRRPDGLASHSLQGIATVAVPSPISRRLEPGQVMERGRRQLAGELPPHDLGTRAARSRPPARSCRSARDRR